MMNMHILLMITFLLSQKIYSAHFEAVDVPYDFECGATNNDIIKECYRANSALPPYESNPCVYACCYKSSCPMGGENEQYAAYAQMGIDAGQCYQESFEECSSMALSIFLIPFLILCFFI